MTAPVDTAYEALRAALETALLAAGFIADGEALKDEPEGPWEPEGDVDGVQVGAALFPLEVVPVRQLMGGTVRRWVVELPCRGEFAIFGNVADGEDSHRVRMRSALDEMAVLPSTDPTLTQTVERLEIGGATYEDLPPSGLKMLVEFTLRLRSGDPLGRTAP